MKQKIYEDTSIVEVSKILNYRIIALLNIVFFLCITTFQVKAQNEHVITIPSKIISSSSGSSGVDPSDLISFISETLDLYASTECLKKINPKLDSCIRAEMKKIKEAKPYLLTVSYKECKFIGLSPDQGYGILKKPDWTIYHITLYPDITLEPDFPAIPIIGKNDNSASKTPILATSQNGNKEWVAIGPYNSSKGYPTEYQALDELFYASPSVLTFICNRGKYKIYRINEKTENVRVNVREVLKQFGVNDICE